MYYIKLSVINESVIFIKWKLLRESEIEEQITIEIITTEKWRINEQRKEEYK